VISIACGAICESFPLATPKLQSRAAHEKRLPVYPSFGKTVTRASLLGKKLSIFLNRASLGLPSGAASDLSHEWKTGPLRNPVLS
jgi:hypothetical protein